MGEKNTVSLERPYRRLTPRMLSTLASCRARFKTEHEDNLRRRSGGSYPWPPRLKDLLRELFWARDEAMCEWGDCDSWDRLVEVIIYHWEMLARSYAPARIDSDELVKTIKATAEEARQIVNHYQNVHHGGFSEPRVWRDKRGPVVRRMVEFKPPVPCDRDGSYMVRSRHSVAICLDKVVSIHGVPWVVVRYLTSDRDREQVVADLKRRMDWRGHAWAAAEEIGCGVAGVLFDVIRTKPPSRPATVKCKSCRGTGRSEEWKSYPGGIPEGQTPERIGIDCPNCAGTGVGGISKQACDTTAEVWKDTLMSHQHLLTEKHAAIHKDAILRLVERGETFAYRAHQKVPREALVEWMFDTYGLIKELDGARRHGRWPRNTSACLGRAGACPYRASCGAVGREREEFVFDKVEDLYPGEHREPSAAVLGMEQYRIERSEARSIEGAEQKTAEG